MIQFLIMLVHANMDALMVTNRDKRLDTKYHEIIRAYVEYAIVYGPETPQSILNQYINHVLNVGWGENLPPELNHSDFIACTVHPKVVDHYKKEIETVT